MLHEKTISKLKSEIWFPTPDGERYVDVIYPQKLKEWAIAIVKELMKCDKGIVYKKNKKCNVILFDDQLLCERHGYQGHPCDGRLVKFLIEKFELNEDDLK